MRLLVLVLGSLLIVSAAPARAGIADSPLPVLVPGQPTNHLYSVTGVVNLSSLATLFACTSTSTTGQTIAVEVFGASGGAPVNDVSTTAGILPAGATGTISTEPVAGFPSGSLGLPVLAHGSARILSTDKKLICTAFLSDALNSPPTSMMYLTIVAKTKQKAAN
jgi:hypothetical protein